MNCAICFFPFIWKQFIITLLPKRICKGFGIDVAHNFNMRIEIPSQLWTLFGSNEQTSLTIVSVSMLKSGSLVTVSMIWLLGRELSFVVGPHCYLKESVNRFALTKISEKLIALDNSKCDITWDGIVDCVWLCVFNPIIYPRRVPLITKFFKFFRKIFCSE